MRHLASIIVLILASITNMNAATPAPPDFAFPQRVSAKANQSLEHALTTSNGPETVRALMDYALAQGAVDSDNIGNVLERIDSVCDMGAVSSDTRSVLRLLMADIYSQLYQQNRWTYDKREISSQQPSNDYKEWSGAQFRMQITSLIDTALTASRQLSTIPLTKWATVISCDVDSRPCFPSLYDFVTYKAIAIIEDISGHSVVQNQKITALYQQLLKLHRDNSPANIYTTLRYRTFINHNSHDFSTARMFNSLSELYASCEETSSYSGLILSELHTYANNISQLRQLHSQCLGWLSRYSDGISTPERGLIPAIRSIISQLEQQRLTAEFNNVTTNRHPLSVKLSSHNATSCTVEIYRLPDTYRHGSRIGAIPPSALKKAETLTVNFPDSGIFETDTIISLSPLTYGNYLISVLLPGQQFNIKNIGYGDIFTVTDLSMQTTRFGTAASILVVNPFTGAPVPDVLLSGLHDIKAKTNGAGMYNVKQKLNYENKIYATAGDDRYSKPLQLYHSPENDSGKWHSHCNLFTDAAIYHPGDTVHFGGIAYQYYTQGNQDSHILPNKVIQAILKNANYIDIDTIECRSDYLGRISGQFILPNDGLTGTFHISLADEFSNSDIGFTVSDYKLPTYMLKVTETRRNIPEYGDITISVKAETYSGFPVSDASVTLNVSQSDRHRWWYTNNGTSSFFTEQTHTDGNGTAQLVIPSHILHNAPIQDGIFTAAITATSQTGETQMTNTVFTQGPSNIISMAFPANFDISSKQLRLPVSVTDLSDNMIDIPLYYALKKGGTIVHEGILSSKSPIVDWSSIKSGVYSITISSSDSTLALPATATDIVLYRLTDKTMPLKADLWLPVNTYTINDNRPTSIHYGTSCSNAHILCTVWTTDTILSPRWLNASAGVHTMDIALPPNIKQATVTLMTINDFRQSSKEITIQRTDIATSLKIEIASFRDRITPGQTERWDISVTDNIGNTGTSGIILDMYSKALDYLKPHNLFLNFHTGHGNRFIVGWPTALNRESIYCQSKLGKNYYFNITQPEFITYGRSFLAQRIYGMRMLKSAARGANMSEAKTEEDAIVTDQVYNSAPLAAAADTGTDISSDYATIETEEATPEAFPVVDTDQYRMPEQPVAFFRPTLTTDSNGRLEFSFTAPNANTTWRLCAAAFTPELLTGTITREIISNKPVMVQPNMPRFLRTGDSAQIFSSVMNNTDSTVTVITHTELFDPASGVVSAIQNDTLTIKAGTSAIVKCGMHAPEGCSFIGFRIRARIPGFSDGEQNVIPILPASTPVMETVPFYIAPTSSQLTLTIPNLRVGGRLTLQMCQNPAWYCVTALPGLRSDDGNTANSAAAAIFSAAIADGFLRDYPQIGQTLHEWERSNRSDSTLVSMLERNQDLKTVLLSATPWMLDAANDSERMTRLALLFDRKEIDKCYSQAIGYLSKLSRKGGWTWAECFNEPSIWVTYNVLTMMGRLSQLGYLPNNKQLNALITDAIGYIDHEAADTYNKYPKSDFTQYAYVRGYFPDVQQPVGAAAATRAAVQRLVRDWRNMSVTDKAVAAIVLHRNKYKTLASQILTSLDQYAKTTPQHGMWWPSLDSHYGWSMSKVGATALILNAYTLIAPNSHQVDDIRQWLILQKESENWGTSVTTTNVIASILTSGTQWIGSDSSMSATISNRVVPLNPTDRSLGYSRTDISEMVNNGHTTLTVDKSGNTPAWGALFNQYTAPMDSIAASSCEAVSIEKRMFMAQDTPKGIDWTETQNYKVGDRVRVQLTVHVNRDMDYVTIIDERAAAFEPKTQLPAPIVAEGIYFYQENRDSSTRMFIHHLPKGTYLLTYDLNVNNAGCFASGIATIQSQYAPQLTAHSSGTLLTVTSAIETEIRER